MPLITGLSAALGLVAGALAADSPLFRAAGLYECPELCSNVGSNTGNWTRFNNNNDLRWCKNQTMVLNLPIYMPLSATSSHSVFSACLATEADIAKTSLRHRQLESTNDASTELEEKVDFLQSDSGTTLPSFAEDATAALLALQTRFLEIPLNDRNQTTFFAKKGDSVVGAYVGGELVKQEIAATVIQAVVDKLAAGTNSQTMLAQLCGADRNANYVVGVIADGRGVDLESVFVAQQFVKTWADGKCVTDVSGPSESKSLRIAYLDGPRPIVSNTTTSNNDTITLSRRHQIRKAGLAHPLKKKDRGAHLSARADCRAIQVAEGDGCASLATRCGISGADFTKYNSDASLCSSLKAGQWVCCSSGTLPDMRPKPGEDGSCFTYTVQANDYCDKIAASHSLKSEDIENLNKNTWGWSGCKSLWPDSRICLSTGDPPMPAPLSNAVCGPQVPGTERPPKGTNLADLNPCPLKACCNIWGQCGITEEFCTEASLGPPGTSEPGKNGCISSCGMEIINNGEAPDTQITLGYFEAWNADRDCLHMDVTQMSTRISHIHFAFVDVTGSFTISTAQVQEQFDKFKGMTGFHKVAAFGGWAASTESTTYWIFRQGVKPGNREILAENMANFIKESNLDGIDIDWEYPGAMDIPGIPSADPFDGEDYLAFLKELRKRLPDKTISIAAPASFWYLKPFPIDEIAKVVDYIVYMTYDLHGQWDWDSKWSMPGCEQSGCLRSHVNMTETIQALAMVTKAGVPAKKIVVGVSSYGRSFQMTEPGCTGPMCGFSGPLSGAEKGRCTDTAGYISNAEIDEILRTGIVTVDGITRRDESVHMFTDDSNSQILVYGEGSHWVAFMDEGEKQRRKEKWSGLNFAGTTDWAVDLATFTPGDDNKECWLSKHCQSPGANDASADSTWRWDQLCTDGAWSKAVDFYRATNGRGESFSRSVADFFHGPDLMDCGSLSGSNGCKAPVMCLQGNGTGPAGTMILNSMISVSSFFSNLYDGIMDSQQTLETQTVLDDFVKVFAPSVDNTILLKIILDIISFGLSAATGPLFNNFLRNSKWWKEGDNKDLGDNLKDTSRAVITFSFTISKDTLKPPPASGAAMSKQLLIIVQQYKEALTETLKAMFSGTAEGIDTISKMIGDGKMLDIEAVPRLEAEKRMTKLFYAMLIPVLWRQKGWHPVLLNPNIACGDENSIDYNFNNPQDSEVCIDGRRYYLVRPENDYAADCPSEAAQHWGMTCKIRPMVPMSGFKDLDGTNFAGLTKENIARSIINRANAGWGNPSEASTFPDFGDVNTFDTLYEYIDGDKMVESPGLVDIPMCGYDEFRRNWISTKNNYHSWPCNKP